MRTERRKNIKTAVKWLLVVFGLIASAIVLQGILTCGWFSWWMIPTGILSGLYLIGMVVIGYIKVRKGEW